MDRGGVDSLAPTKSVNNVRDARYRVLLRRRKQKAKRNGETVMWKTRRLIVARAPVESSYALARKARLEITIENELLLMLLSFSDD